MSLLIKNMTIENDEHEFIDLGNGNFKIPRNGTQTITIAMQDTDKHQEIEVTLKGKVIEQRQRPMMEYERLQYDPEFARLEEIARQLKKQLMDKEFELMKLRKQQGVPVEAGKKDWLFLVGEEFHGSFEFVLAEAGLKLEEVDTDLWRVVADTEDFEHELNPMCSGHSLQEHDPLPMADYGNEWQCTVCAATKPKL